MKVQINSTEVELVQGDIVLQQVDALVNAANTRLAGGGGVDGAIHRAGGPAIMQESRRRYPEGCPTGDAVVTGAGQLQARYVIHAVGPVYSTGKAGEPEKLANAYRRCLEVALANGCASMAFPSLSTGAYRYPTSEAAPIALRTVVQFIRDHPGALRVIRFVLFDQETLGIYGTALEQILGVGPKATQ
jgi:O-acetyl-ADP-ribose deacetylase (regulator of RNase III)